MFLLKAEKHNHKLDLSPPTTSKITKVGYNLGHRSPASYNQGRYLQHPQQQDSSTFRKYRDV